jgi:hypothetical protein
VTLLLDEADGGRRLPLALLAIGRSAAPTVEATVPAAVALDAGAGTLH